VCAPETLLFRPRPLNPVNANNKCKSQLLKYGFDLSASFCADIRLAQGTAGIKPPSSAAFSEAS